MLISPITIIKKAKEKVEGLVIKNTDDSLFMPKELLDIDENIVPYTLMIPYVSEDIENICIHDKDIIQRSYIYDDTKKKILYLQIITVATLDMIRAYDIHKSFHLFYTIDIESIKDFGIYLPELLVPFNNDTVSYLPYTRVHIPSEDGDFMAMGFMAPKHIIDDELDSIKEGHTVHKIWFTISDEDKKDFNHIKILEDFANLNELVVIHSKESEISEHDLKRITANAYHNLKSRIGVVAEKTEPVPTKPQKQKPKILH